MDTKWKKTHKFLHSFGVLIIILTIVLPSVVIVSLYPMMEESAEELIDEAGMEVTYYLHNDIYIDVIGHLLSKRLSVMAESNDKLLLDTYKEVYRLNQKREMVEKYCYYYIELDGYLYTNSSGAMRNALKNKMDSSQFDARGEEELINQGVCYYVSFIADEDLIEPFRIKERVIGDVSYHWSSYPLEESLYDYYEFSDSEYVGEPYTEEETTHIEDSLDEVTDSENILQSEEILDSMLGKCKAIYVVAKDSGYIYEHRGYLSRESAYERNGAFYILAAAVILVGLVAFIMPFIKVFGTGREKLFRMPLLVEILVGTIAVMGAPTMYYLMAYSAEPFMEFLRDNFADTDSFMLLGYDVDETYIYGCIYGFNFLCFMVFFLLEYMTMTALHQIIFHPVEHFKNRTLTAKAIKAAKKSYNDFKIGLVEIPLNEGLKRNIIIIIVGNFIIISILCCLWFAGIIGAIVYTAVLTALVVFVLLKVKEKYNKLLDATKEMSEGNIKVKIDDDFGVFSELGENLTKIKEGFSKAVTEEAKSQNMKTELITNVSHDLKTPLTAIITYVNLLKDENISEEDRKKYIETLDMKSQRLKSLIEDLFEISKANSGNVQMNYMDVDIVDLIKQVRLEMEDKIMDGTVAFRFNLPEEKIVLSLDSQRTYRIFENLITNIYKYSMEGSRAYVDVISDEKEVSVIMKNVSKAEISCDAGELTERFVRGDVSRNSEGSGLGLAIVKSFVELQNGSFHIETDGDLFKAVITWPR